MRVCLELLERKRKLMREISYQFIILCLVIQRKREFTFSCLLVSW